jgi:hypothetical protein
MTHMLYNKLLMGGRSTKGIVRMTLLAYFSRWHYFK